MDEDLLKDFGERVKADRKIKGWTQTELAEALLASAIRSSRFNRNLTNGKVSGNYILRVEKGQRKYIREIESEWLADALGVDPREYSDLLDISNRNLVTELADIIKGHHERSSLFVMPATGGDESFDSPSMILLYFYFLMNTEGKLTIIKREHKFVSLTLLTALLSRYTTVTAEGVQTKEFRIHESRELIDDLYGALNRHNVKTSLDFDYPSDQLIDYIAQRISIQILSFDNNVPEETDPYNDNQVSLLQEIADLNPVSYFTFVPYRGDKEYVSCYSFGGDEYGELKAHDSEQIHRRFKKIEKHAYNLDSDEVIMVDIRNEIDTMVEYAKKSDINFYIPEN